MEENADRLSRSRPTIPEAWSLRAHGLVERTSPAVIMIGAAFGLLLGVWSVIALFSGALTADPWQTGMRFTAHCLSAFLISASAGAIMLRGGRIAAESALVALALSAIAWTLGAAAAAAWGVGFNEADAGASRSWFSEAFTLFAGAAWFFGSCALFLIAFGLLRAIRPHIPRVILSALLAVSSALVLALASVRPTGMVLVAAVVLVVASLQFRPRTAATKRVVRAPCVLLPRQRNRIATLAAIAAVLGVGCAAFALTGSRWFPVVGNSSDAMRGGILGGALVGIITVAASAEVLMSRRGRGALGPAAAAIGALLSLALSYSLGIDDVLGWPLLVFAAALTGLTGGLLLAPLLPGPPTLRGVLVLAISLALAVSLGLIMITTVAFVAPLLATILAVSTMRRPRQVRARSNPTGTLPKKLLGRASS